MSETSTTIDQRYNGETTIRFFDDGSAFIAREGAENGHVTGEEMDVLREITDD